jgi:PhoPQ-activated pathogenicity-related protein
VPRLCKLLTLFLALSLVPLTHVSAAQLQGPLGDYVAQADDSYAWTKRREGDLLGGKFVELTLTSQTWRGIVWKHSLFIYKPAEVPDASQALLLIAGGRWRPELAEPPTEADQKLPKEAMIVATLGNKLKSPVATIMHVPQQPIFDGLSEDAAISYTFEQYMKTGDQTWPLLLPMVKSAVRAMDATQEFAKQEWNLDIKHFTVTGASKRGWTTWLTGAVDDRANAIAPMVIDTLNMNEQMKHQFASWGKYSEQIEDYTEKGLQNIFETPRGRKLTEIVDPYFYREALSKPKLILNGTNDRYWALDALNLYWGDLPGEKHVLYVPNRGHDLDDLPRVVGSIAALHESAAGRLKLPALQWKHEINGHGNVLHVSSDQKPAKISAWVAKSNTLDFREATWSAEEMKANGDGFEYTLEPNGTGYAAVFGEALYENGDGTLPFYLSTNVKIIGGKDQGTGK